MSSSKKQRIVILGAGFGGVYTAMHLEKFLHKKDNVEIVLVNKENYFVYQPMLAEVVGGAVGLIDTVSSLRKLLPKTTLFVREIES
ncbi:MAG: NAD(P)/FAD-dependent oxidoreductase, partial [Chlamydiae bacterium]|nr:NAD(P)/FAD-dependent oxidoreductase [Chlamydiota bacterium]